MVSRLQRRRKKWVGRLKNVCFYHLLRGGIRWVPLKRYQVAARLMASRFLKTTVLSVEGGQWVIFPRIPSTWAFPLGLKEPHLSYWLKDFFRQADGFIDCGANLGWYSFLASRHNCIRRLVAVEPIHQSLAYLKFIKRLNQIENLIPIQGCLNNKDGKVPFSFPKQRFSEMGCVDLSWREGREERLLLDSPSYTLESIVNLFPPSTHRLCLKVDIEGHEKVVLKSISRQTLAQRVHSAVVEVHLYKFQKPTEELEEIYEILSVVGKPQFLLPPQLSPSYSRFRQHLLRYYPPSRLNFPTILDLVRRGFIPEVHVLVRKEAAC